MAIKIAIVFTVLSLQNTTPEAPQGCMLEAWANNLVARSSLDLQTSRIRHSARADNDTELESITSDLLLEFRDQNTQHLIETACKNCLSYWLDRRVDVRSSFSIVVRHSLSEPTDSLSLAETTLTWYEELLEEGNIDAVSVGGLRDRILIHTDGVQRYGTHRACINGRWTYDPPLEDPENLEARRDALNWPQAARPPMGGECNYD